MMLKVSWQAQGPKPMYHSVHGGWWCDDLCLEFLSSANCRPLEFEMSIHVGVSDIFFFCAFNSFESVINCRKQLRFIQ